MSIEDEFKEDFEDFESDMSDDLEETDVTDEIDSDDVDEDDPLSPIHLSKHKMQNKHALKYDTIFKGRKDDPLDEWEDFDTSSFYESTTIEVDSTSSFHMESMNNEDYIWDKKLSEKVYELLVEHTDIDFEANRRKPSKTDFNEYYKLLKDNLTFDGFTSTELFLELSIYFSNNTLNMFKLLDHNWRLEILDELRKHIGERVVNLELTASNINEGTEVEFENVNENGVYKSITGRVVSVTDGIYEIDSYEKVYHVKFEDIVKILNNKFKFNMNKLEYIDFL